MATRKDLVKKLSKDLDYLQAQDVRYALDSVLEYLKDGLIEGNRVEVRGFGSLSIREREYSDKDGKYNTVYYRMPKNIKDVLERD
ncbi:HU family DNA-binding protein [Rickettsiaceae bacterium]|nr:HU family DNA-binding protein [Rickettsiaceae bacterium]